MRKLIIVAGISICLLLLGYTGYRTFQVWKQGHLMSMAKGYIAKSDIRNTMLCLQQLLHTNPRNIDACRMMANFTQAVRNPDALVWRQKVAELNPGSLDDRLALVQTALIFQDYPLATNALAGVAEPDKKSAAYQNLAGTVALVTGQPGQAEAHFSESLRIDPSNPVPQVNLAMVRLRSTNVLDLAEARISLRRIILNSTNAALCSQARRELINDAMRFNDIPVAMGISKELAEQANPNFADKLLRLDVLLKIKSSEFQPTLTSYQNEAATNLIKLYELTNWQMNRLSPAAALNWLQSLPMQTRTNQPAALLDAQCLDAVRDWRGLQGFLQNQDWAEREFMRHTFLARSLRELNLAESSKAEWQLALNDAVGIKDNRQKKIALTTIFQIAAQWRWQNEAEEILWTIVNSFPDEPSAALSLRQDLIQSGRTRPLLQLISIQMRRNPNSVALKNDLAMVALLLDAQEFKPNDLAREAYQQNPKNSSIVSTYAFSLYLQGKSSDALKAMQQLDQRTLSIPEIGDYYGLILKASGHPAEAKAYLQLASRAHLLPEEKVLFDKAIAGL
jgi:Flp pilus assembly protein TadD